MELQLDQKVRGEIDGEVLDLFIIGIDSDPRADVWVIEANNVDAGHFIPRFAIIDIIGVR